MKKKDESRYRLYVFLDGAPIKGPYRAEELSEYIYMLDDLILTDEYPLSHISIVEYDRENKMDTSIYTNWNDRENYLQFRETNLVKEDNQKVLTKGMKKCNMNYGADLKKRKYTSS